MGISKSNKGFWKATLIVVIFAIALISFRLLWNDKYTQSEQPSITDGELDLRTWDFSEGQSVMLNGTWAFYPYQFHTGRSDEVVEKKTLISVPGDWSETLNPDNDSSYGFGTYHLRILVDSEIETTYQLQVPSVRSASALYANGLLVGESGKVGEDAHQEDAFNVPYLSTSIYADESGVIDVFLQSSNFIDPRRSGFVRSIKFGHEKDLTAEVNLSSLLQISAAAIFLVHALFAGLLYLVGFRDKRLLYFALVIITVALTNLMSGDEKILFNYIKMDYVASFRLSMILMVICSWALIHCAAPQIQAISKKLLPAYTIYSSFVIVFTLLVPMEKLAQSSNFSFINLLVAAGITILAFFWDRKQISGSIWLTLSIVALANNYLWWGISLGTGMKVVYYPFDLMIAVICFAGVWFKHYHRMHTESQHLAVELQKADQMKDEFLATTSHELRNPLHSILNMSQAVLEREHASITEKSAKDLATVLSVSRRMSVLVEELLDMTRLKEGTPQLNLEPVSLQAISAGVIDMLEFMVEDRPVRLISQIPADFPLVMADENRVTQVVFNLLQNAIKYTQKGNVTIRVQMKDDCAMIAVIDTGIGMDEETLKDIFNPYMQFADTQKVVTSGFGLGLYVSKKLVELHGSSLQVQSTLGEGTIFTFTLPIAQDDVKRAIDASVEGIMTHTLTATQQNKQESITFGEVVPRILVVDDDAVNLQVVETILATENYEVVTALSGEKALALLNEKEFDLMISDVMMPQMSGYELTKQIRERFTISELPILLLTARSQPIDIENGFFAGANDYVKKPVDALELRARVRALTDLKRITNERLRLEAAWLQAQIQPHFLFNALNTILALSNIDLDRMRDVLDAFSYLLRKKFQFNRINELTKIHNEIELIEAYLLIEKERYQERLHVNWEVDDVISVLIPALTIQPLVENAILHGLMKKEGGGQLTIRVHSSRELIHVSIEDDGVGMEASFVERLFDQTNSSQLGIGLVNTHLRLKQRYGKGLAISSELGKGTIVSFEIPIEK